MGIIKDFTDFLLPRTCHICGELLIENEERFCTRCIETLPRSRYHLMEMNPMEQRFAGVVRYERATGHFIYSRNSGLANAIHDMKYRRFPGVGYRLGEIVGEELNMAGFFEGADYVAGVPMHWWKKAKRGYNQVDYIARGISASTGLEIADVLRASKPHKTQTSMTLEQRQLNLTGTFAVTGVERLRGKGIVVVDDVCTTGATLRCIAEVLTEAIEDCRVYLLSVCVTV